MKCEEVNGKLAPRYIGPFKILERHGEVATSWNWRRVLGVHDVFHVSQIKKCLRITRRANTFRRTCY